MQRKGEYEVGRGRPPKSAQFQKGQSGNPKGKTSEQKKAEMKAGELAAQIQMRMLEALNNAVLHDDAQALQAIAADPLRLIKDAMDREFGTAVQKVDNTSSDGSMAPTRIVIEAARDNGKD
jgi:hypothetical protein